jgi:hypothetical protein
MNPLSLVCSVPDAAALLGVTERRVLVFIDEGRIDAKRLKREWVLSLASVKAFKRKPRPGGRPKG